MLALGADTDAIGLAVTVVAVLLVAFGAWLQAREAVKKPMRKD